MPPVATRDYIDLVNDTGHRIRADKHGSIPTEEPRALAKLGLSADH
jgi:hypothetical protein